MILQNMPSAERDGQHSNIYTDETQSIVAIWDMQERRRGFAHVLFIQEKELNSACCSVEVVLIIWLSSQGDYH